MPWEFISVRYTGPFSLTIMIAFYDLHRCSESILSSTIPQGDSSYTSLVKKGWGGLRKKDRLKRHIAGRIFCPLNKLEVFSSPHTSRTGIFKINCIQNILLSPLFRLTIH